MRAVALTGLLLFNSSRLNHCLRRSHGTMGCTKVQIFYSCNLHTPTASQLSMLDATYCTSLLSTSLQNVKKINNACPLHVNTALLSRRARTHTLCVFCVPHGSTHYVYNAYHEGTHILLILRTTREHTLSIQRTTRKHTHSAGTKHHKGTNFIYSAHHQKTHTLLPFVP